MHSIFLSLLAATHVFALWPIPRSFNSGLSYVKLDPSFDIKLRAIQRPPNDLLDAICITKGHLLNDKHERLVVGRGALDRNTLQNAPSLLTLELSLDADPKSIMEEATKPIGTRIEAYTLTIPSTGGTATITANSTLGLFRGLTTFEQLFYFDGHRTVYTYQAPIHIVDSPAYPYRGFMLDTSRNFFPVGDIKRTLDAMSMLKMSQFHWHVVDATSFPLYIPGYPELSEKGAYSSKEIYSTQDVEDIVKYAGARGIDVLMEIDTPAHTSIISESHPEHVACPVSPWETFAAEPPAGQLRISSAATADFTAGFLSAMAKTLPSTLFGTGGDEINQNCYKYDANTQADLAASGKTLEQAFDSFTQTTHAALKKIGKTPVVWDDLVLNHDVTLSKDTIVKIWHALDKVGAVVEKGFRIIHASYEHFYLDCGQGAWIGNAPNGNSWCDPFKSWQKAYTFNPQANISTDKSHHVLGGQHLLWTEQSDPSNLDSIAWPRAAASAEVFWTGPTLPDGSSLNVKSALARLHDIRYRMVRRGIMAIALQPHWCALRDGSCDL